jgi:RNA polymerase sigma-70 factor (family 1)
LQQSAVNTKHLFNQISAGNRDAFDMLFRNRYARLVSFAQTFVHESDLAEEAVSDVFVSLWIHREKLTTIDNVDTYLYVSVKNRCLNALRNKTYSVTIDEQDNMETAEYENPHEAMEHRELYEKLNRLINQLPEQQRIIFRMIKENGLTAKQTAEILHLSPRTVETHIYKALQRLEKEITDYLGYSPKRKAMNRMIMLSL